MGRGGNAGLKKVGTAVLPREVIAGLIDTCDGTQGGVEGLLRGSFVSTKHVTLNVTLETTDGRDNDDDDDDDGFDDDGGKEGGGDEVAQRSNSGPVLPLVISCRRHVRRSGSGGSGGVGSSGRGAGHTGTGKNEANTEGEDGAGDALSASVSGGASSATDLTASTRVTTTTLKRVLPAQVRTIERD